MLGVGFWGEMWSVGFRVLGLRSVVEEQVCWVWGLGVGLWGVGSAWSLRW